MFRIRFLLAVVCMLIIAATGTAFACVGARPLAMGGAFAGLADDANATYWNPAGLTQLSSPVITTMHTSTNRDEINYQDYVGLTFPLTGGMAVGLSWIKDNLSLGLEEIDQEDWYWVSFAYKADQKTSYGINIKQVNSSISGLETDIALDFGVLYKLDKKWTIGLLIQDINEPMVSQDGTDIARWARNWRPGCAYRPDPTSIVSAEIYDAADGVDSRSLRIGYEKWLSSKLAARAGYYGLGSSDSNALTLGIGFVMPGGTGQYKPSLDVAIMVGDIDAVFASLTVKF